MSSTWPSTTRTTTSAIGRASSASSSCPPTRAGPSANTPRNSSWPSSLRPSWNLRLKVPGQVKSSEGEDALYLDLIRFRSPCVDQDHFQLGSLSHLLNAKAGGYQELPDWPEAAPDPSVRNVEVKESVRAVAFSNTQSRTQSGWARVWLLLWSQRHNAGWWRSSVHSLLTLPVMDLIRSLQQLTRSPACRLVTHF